MLKKRGKEGICSSQPVPSNATGDAEVHPKSQPKPRGRRKTLATVPSNATGEAEVSSSAPQPSASVSQAKQHVKKSSNGRPLKIRKIGNIPHGTGTFWSPFTDRHFEVFGNRVYDRTDHNPQPPEDLNR